MNQIHMIFFWLVGGARHDVRATGPNRNLFGTYGLGGGGGNQFRGPKLFKTVENGKIEPNLQI